MAGLEMSIDKSRWWPLRQDRIQRLNAGKNDRMKKNGASHALVSPGATGWRIRINGGIDNTVPTLDEALDAIPVDAHIELSLPCQSVLLERHTLPATDRAELADMLQLQLEKTLPFPVEEV